MTNNIDILRERLFNAISSSRVTGVEEGGEVKVNAGHKFLIIKTIRQ